MATTTANKPKLYQGTEMNFPGTMKVDREHSVVRGVKIIGRNSKNGRDYTEPALRGAVQMYEGAPVNVDHPEKFGNPRGYRDRFGRLRDVRAEADGLYGDLHYNPHHAVAEQFLYDAEHSPENLGLSANHLFRGERRNGRMVVESIAKVISVDLVADPATTRGLFESLENPMADEMLSGNAPAPAANVDPMQAVSDALVSEIMKIASGEGDAKTKGKAILELLKKQEKIIDMLAGEPKEPANDKGGEESVRLKALVDSLTTQVNTFKAMEAKAVREKAVNEAIVAAGLDPANKEHVSDAFGKLLAGTESIDDVKALVEDRATILGKKAPAAPPAAKTPAFSKPVSKTVQTPVHAGTEAVQPVKDAKEFAASITGRRM